MKGKWQDSIWAAAAAKGDHEAFGRLYDKYAQRLFKFIVWRVGSKEEAQDLTANVFLKTWQYISNERRPIENFQALMYRIAANAVVDYHRQKGKERLIENIDQWRNLIDHRADAESDLQKKDDWQRVAGLLDKLSSSEKELLLMRFVEDLSFAEIAKILDKSQVAVRVALHRAIKSLKAKLEEKSD